MDPVQSPKPMPWVIEEDESFSPALIGPQDPLSPPESTPTPPSWMESLGASFRLENLFGSMFSAERGQPMAGQRINRQFDPFALIPDDKRGQAWKYVWANSPAEVEAISRQLDREARDRETQAASGPMGLAWDLVSGVADPLNLLPLGGLRRGASLLSNVGRTAALTAGVAGLQEAALQATQANRPLAQSGLAVAGGAFLGGVLGGAGHWALDAFERAASKGAASTLESLGLKVEQELTPPAVGRFTPQQLADAERRLSTAQVLLDQFKTNPNPSDPQWAKLLQRHAAAQRGLDSMRSARARDEQALLSGQRPSSVLFDPELRALDQEAQFLSTRTPDLQKRIQAGESIFQASGNREPLDRALLQMAEHEGKLEAVSLQRERLLASRNQMGEDWSLAAYDREIADQQTLVNDLQGQLDAIQNTPLNQRDAFIRLQREVDRYQAEVDRIRGGVHEPDLLEPGAVEVSAEALAQDTGRPALGRSATEAELLKNSQLLERLPGLRSQDPLIRTTLSPALATRQAVQRLAEVPLKYAKNALGIATQLPAEAIARQSRAGLATALKQMDDLFLEYRLGRAGKPGEKARILLGDLAGAPEETLSYQQFKEAIGMAMRRGDKSPIPQVQEAAQVFRREVFDPLKQKAISLGLLPADTGVDTALSYVTRVWNIERINARYDEFFELNMRWLREKEGRLPAGYAEAGAAGRTEAQLQEVVEQLIERIRGTPEGRLRYNLLGDDPDRLDAFRAGGGSPGKPGPLQERVYDIPDAWAEGFLENDIEYLAKTYERSLAPDLALVEVFGDTTLENEFQAIIREYSEKQRQVKTETQRIALKNRMDRDISDLAAMRDRIRGTYGIPQDPDSVFVRGGRMLRSLNYLSLMGGVALSSIPDIARPMMVHGLRRYLQDGLVPLITEFKAFRASAKEVKLAGAALDMILDSRAMQLAEVMDDYGRGSVLERLMGSLQSGMNVASGITPWTAFTKQFAGMITQTRILESVEALKAGRITGKDLEALAASYIDREMAVRIANQYELFGVTERGGVRIANTERWADREAARVFRAALARDVERIIVTPGQDKPLWMSSEWGKLLGQFRSFFFASAQRVLMSGLQDKDLATLNGLVFAVGLGTLTHIVQSGLAGREISWEVDDLIVEGVDRSGVTGWLMDANATVEKFTRGRLGVSALLGKEPMSRYASRNVTDALLGPSVGRVEDLARGTGALATGEVRPSDIRAVRRLLPFQNLFYTRWLFDRGEDGLNEALGLEVERAKAE